MRYFVVDAFADRVFQGNPAGVCLVDSPLDDAVMQAIASENNLSETAFVVVGDPVSDLRWFTPAVEIDLCGHATLGTAYVLANFVEPAREMMRFATRSGELVVTRDDDRYTLDFPARPAVPIPVTEAMAAAIGVPVLEAHQSPRDLMLVVGSETEVRDLAPDIPLVAALAEHAVIVTAPGDQADFVSRFFAPNLGVPEDPVTGSAHATLIPYWTARTGKTDLVARQLSRRGGTLYCRMAGDRVHISGTAQLYLRGEITAP